MVAKRHGLLSDPSVQVGAAPHFQSNSHIRNTCPANGSISGRSMVMSLVLWIRLAGKMPPTWVTPSNRPKRLPLNSTDLSVQLIRLRSRSGSSAGFGAAQPQPKAARALRRRVRTTEPMAPKPNNIVAQVAGSGTPAATPVAVTVKEPPLSP
jgi:hypothetical protein